MLVLTRRAFETAVETSRIIHYTPEYYYAGADTSCV